MPDPRIHYHLSIDDLAGKRLGVALHLAAAPGALLRLRMPVWVPGSYLVREYAGHVVRLTASAGGRPLAVRKQDKATWVMDAPAGRPIEVRWQVFAPELSVRTNDISHDHAFVSPGGTFLAVEGLEQEPVLLTVTPPARWHVAVALDTVSGSPVEPGKPATFLAPDFDTLVDSPLEIGSHAVHAFEVEGRRHELVVHGEGNLDLPRLMQDTPKLVEVAGRLFGELPYRRYLFILHLTHDRSGGLEHAFSSAVAWPKLKFRPEKEYRKFLSLVAHEFFHVWNVKRIKPEVLLRPDYSREVYTRLLWVFEGITSYYDELLPLRAGLYRPKDYFELLCERVVSEASRPGREVQSLADSSFDTWIKLYRPSPDTSNSQVSYYERGQMVALLFDLELRRRSNDARCLDDVMRALYHQVYKQGRGLPEDGLRDLVLEATGVDTAEFLRLHVDGIGPLRYDEALAHVGLRLSAKPRTDDKPEPGWLGLRMENGGNANRIATVLSDSPAHHGGLMAGDELIALNGHRLGHDLAEQIELFHPGEAATWTAFRRDRLVQGSVVFGSDPNPPLEVLPVEKPTAQQCRSFQHWTGAGWPFDAAG